MPGVEGCPRADAQSEGRWGATPWDQVAEGRGAILVAPRFLQLVENSTGWVARGDRAALAWGGDGGVALGVRSRETG